MSTGLIIATYFTVWFITLFMVLPFGVNIPEQRDNKAHYHAAPEKIHMGKKILANTVLAAVVTLIIVLVVNQYMPATRHVV